MKLSNKGNGRGIEKIIAYCSQSWSTVFTELYNVRVTQLVVDWRSIANEAATFIMRAGFDNFHLCGWRELCSFLIEERKVTWFTLWGLLLSLEMFLWMRSQHWHWANKAGLLSTTQKLCLIPDSHWSKPFKVIMLISSWSSKGHFQWDLPYLAFVCRLSDH